MQDVKLFLLKQSNKKTLFKLHKDCNFALLHVGDTKIIFFIFCATDFRFQNLEHYLCRNHVNGEKKTTCLHRYFGLRLIQPRPLRKWFLLKLHQHLLYLLEMDIDLYLCGNFLNPEQNNKKINRIQIYSTTTPPSPCVSATSTPFTEDTPSPILGKKEGVVSWQNTFLRIFLVKKFFGASRYEKTRGHP